MPDGRVETLLQHLEELRLRAQGAASWLTTSRHYEQLLNREGVVPVTARFTAEDLAFLANAREELLRFAELGLRLAELHQPQEATAITSDPAGQFHRCGSCMWRWPCPTFRILDEVLSGGLRSGGLRSERLQPGGLRSGGLRSGGLRSEGLEPT